MRQGLKFWLSGNLGALAAALLLSVVGATPIPAMADTVASLLGNFTINQYSGLRLDESSIKVHYVVVFGQLPALRELHIADTDGDGVTTQAERDAYLEQLAPTLARQISLSVDGSPVPLRVASWSTSLPTEQGGFSLRFDVDFTAALADRDARAIHKLNFENGNYAGRFGWQEIVVETSPSISAFDTNAFSTSLTGGLTEAVTAMPTAGPLSERAISLRFTSGVVPNGGESLRPRPDTALPNPQSAAPLPGNSDAAWLQRETRRLINLISTPEVAPHIALLALLASLLLGAIHAFSPGHGKTVVGAYLIGSRATLRHAAFLGATVTITHTLGVFALGFATLLASRFIVPERLFPILSLLSGLLILGMGIALLTQRWRGVREALQPHANNVTPRLGRPAARSFRPLDMQYGLGKPAARLMMVGAHSHAPMLESGDHCHEHGHGVHVHHHHPRDAGKVHDGSIMHSHGGSLHSHLPPGTGGDRVTWRSLLALGISGGLVPCPSAMVLLLAAIALNKTAYGLLLVVAFSVGLAMTLVAVGMVFLYARDRIRSPISSARWPKVLPALSAAAITLIGAFLCYGALSAAQF